MKPSRKRRYETLAIIAKDKVDRAVANCERIKQAATKMASRDVLKAK